MKLAAIYNLWDGEELIQKSIDIIRPHVDLIIVVVQKESNYGEPRNPMEFITMRDVDYIMHFTPNLSASAMVNETAKRQLGLALALNHKCTHFIHLDADEYWLDFATAKKEYCSTGKDGSVAWMWTYFKTHKLRLALPEQYYVPFIHRLLPDTAVGVFRREYPFYVDPTRNVNTKDVGVIQTKMHHLSWVRDDIERKVRNSTARANIERSQILADYNSPKLGAGYYLQDYRQKLVETNELTGVF